MFPVLPVEQFLFFFFFYLDDAFDQQHCSFHLPLSCENHFKTCCHFLCNPSYETFTQIVLNYVFYSKQSVFHPCATGQQFILLYLFYLLFNIFEPS